MSNYQKFELQASFKNEESLHETILELERVPLGANTRSQQMPCTICSLPLDSEQQHKMLVRYYRCSHVKCSNNLQCFKILKCLSNNSCQFYESNGHLNSLLTTPRTIKRRISDESSPNTSKYFIRKEEKEEEEQKHQSSHKISEEFLNDDDTSTKKDDLVLLDGFSNYISDFPDISLESDLRLDELMMSNLLDSRDGDNNQGSLMKNSTKTQLDEARKRSIWKSGIMLTYKSNNTWFEYNMDEDEMEHVYKEVSREADYVVLFDKHRNLFVKLTTKHKYESESATNFPEKSLIVGKWIEFTAWKEDKGFRVYFRRVDKRSWEKLVDGESDGEYAWLKSVGDETILFKDRQYFKLTWRDWSTSETLSDWQKIAPGSYTTIEIIRP